MKMENTQKNVDFPIRQQLVALREKETFHHRLLGGKYSGTAQSIAETIRERQEVYQWLRDSIELETNQPLSNDEGLELIELLYFFQREVPQGINDSLPSVHCLWNEAEFKEHCGQEEAIKNELSKYEQTDADIKTQLPCLPPEKREILLRLLDDLSKVLREMGNQADWHQSALQDVLHNKFQFWRRRWYRTRRGPGMREEFLRRCRRRRSQRTNRCRAGFRRPRRSGSPCSCSCPR